jgi:hypothetical protein
MQKHRSRNRAAVVGAVIVGVAIIAIAAILIGKSGSSSSGSPGKAEASVGKKKHAAREPEAKASASELPVREEETQPTTTSSEPAGVAALEPFQGHLYSAEVPVGWTPEEVETHRSTYYESRWRYPEDENTSVLIDSQIHTADSDAVEDAEGVREETARSPGYRELAFEETALQGQQAVRWVFEVEGDRRVDYFVINCGVGFGILGSSSPTTFGSWAPTFHAVADSVTGICE